MDPPSIWPKWVLTSHPSKSAIDELFREGPMATLGGPPIGGPLELIIDFLESV